MPRKTRAGRGAAVAAAKRKAKNDSSPPAKVKREDSENTKLREAIKEVVKSETGKKRIFKPDNQLSDGFSCVTIHEDYSCMLNQTNIGQNNNKFYVIQVAKSNKLVLCFTKWGRVGEPGKSKCDDYTNIDDAIEAFEKKFNDKTKNKWENKDNFTPVKGKYTLIEMDEESDDEDMVDSKPVLTKKMVGGMQAIKCSLNIRTQLLIKLIFNDDMFNGQMSSMQLDVKKMPLGKLKKAQIAKGLDALLDLEAAIKANKAVSTLSELTSKFYTLIPHSFGRSTPPVIRTESIVTTKKEMMMTLSDIELTQSMQKTEAAVDSVHPLEAKYNMLDTGLELVTKSSKEFKLLDKYSKVCKNTRKGPLLDVWRVDRKGEDERFQNHDDIDFRKLLWHGTNVAVVAAILKAGMRIMPHAGGLVGKGLYFASEHAKSSWYVNAHNGTFEGESNVGFMFLVEVALGKMKFITRSDGSLTKAPNGYNSIVARGSSEPDPKSDATLTFDGREVVVPVGTPVPQKEFKDSHFGQSEYLIYNESQARIRYILKYSFT